MNERSPWVGVVTIAVGGVMAVAFALLHIAEAAIPAIVVTTGVGMLQGIGHAQVRRELNSLRPPPLPASTSEERH